MAESKIQKKIIKLLDRNNYWNCKVIKSNKDGTADIIACEPITGLFIALEVKEDTDESPLQEYQRMKIRGIGGRAYVVRSQEEVAMILGLEL